MKSYFFVLVVLALAMVACGPQTQSVTLFYYDPAKDQDGSGNLLCSPAGLALVERELRADFAGEALIEETIRLLMAGDLSAAERAQGITTDFPLEDLALTTATLVDGELTLSFDDPNFRTSGGACRVAILWAQIEGTARQFVGVEQVRYTPEELFQP